MIAALWLTLPVDPWSLVRVEDPDWPGAAAASDTGATLFAPPPPGVPWTTEIPALPDAWRAEEAIDAVGAAPWHAAGHRGQGVRIAVFDVQWDGALDPDELGAFTTHDCWAHPSCEVPLDPLRPRFSFEEGGHGIACAEVVRDLAPEAELSLVRVSTRTTFENAVAWAIRNEIDVVTMSLTFATASFHDGTGPVNRGAQALAEAGVLLVTSAGNTADAHWGGPWVDGDRDGRLDFDGSGRLEVLLFPGMGPILAQWDQHRACGLTDLDLTLFDAAGAIVGRGEDRQRAGADRCEPVERVRASVDEAQWGWLEVRHVAGAEVDVDVDVLSMSGRFRHPEPRGSVADPASSPFALAVGAVRADGYAGNEIEPYSSRGDPRRGVFKPDLAGPDGVSTSVYGGAGFFGTSAASPAVAAAIAVRLSAGDLPDAHAAAADLRATALDGAPTWEAPDPRWGAGKVRLPSLDREAAGCAGRAGGLVWLGPLLAARARRRHERRDLG